MWFIWPTKSESLNGTPQTEKPKSRRKSNYFLICLNNRFECGALAFYGGMNKIIIM